MPVRFAVTTSVTSGLIVAAVLWLVRVDTPATAVWVVLATAGLAVLCWSAFTAFAQARRRSRTAFVMTAAFDQKYYMAALVQRMHGALDRAGIDMVLKVPERDYDAGAMAHHLDRLLTRRRDYLGGVVVTTEVVRLRDDLSEFCRKSRLPVVFTDLEPYDTEDAYPTGSVYLGYDTGELGELAGRWLANHLRGRRRPQVLIVASTEHPARQERCAAVLRKELRGIELTVDDTCAFTRGRAHVAVLTHLRRLSPRQCLDAVVCTNDEMALGAVDALTSAPHSSATDKTIVVGIDGIEEARALIDSADSPLRATVVQDPHRLAVAIVDLLTKMQRGRRVPKRTILPAEVHEAR